jgi:hypothetical protein
VGRAEVWDAERGAGPARAVPVPDVVYAVPAEALEDSTDARSTDRRSMGIGAGASVELLS